MSKYGLIGKNIDYSFSKKFFSEKFQIENSSNTYQNFDLKNLNGFSSILKNNPTLNGLNVTIPYKETIIPYLDSLHIEAEKIGAVNTIKFNKDGSLTGYNTDYFGFQKALEPFLPFTSKNALILGTGGASKAIIFALENMGFSVLSVARKHKNDAIVYSEINKDIIAKHTLIINCTPVGTFPEIDNYPLIPYQYITQNHLLFDLIYNPAETQFLKKGRENGAHTTNGLKMLEFQAEKAWEIWNS